MNDSIFTILEQYSQRGATNPAAWKQETWKKQENVQC